MFEKFAHRICFECFYKIKSENMVDFLPKVKFLRKNINQTLGDLLEKPVFEKGNADWMDEIKEV